MNRGDPPGAPARVSVVTPCLNPGPRLLRCLESVAAQGADVEHVVVDGGSTDGTVDVLRRREAIRWVSEPDTGQTAAINKGIAMAQGDVVSWLNADDVLLPGAAEAVAAAIRGSAPDVVYGQCRVVERGRPLVTYAPREFSLTMLDAGEYPPQPATFVARRALERVGPLDESFHLAMDVDLWLRLAANGARPTRLGAVLAEFELHEESKTGTHGLAPFLREACIAYRKSGRREAAAVALGRAAAVAAFAEGRGRPECLRAATTRVLADELARGLDPRAVRAGALAEAAVLSLRSSPAGVRYAVSPAPWRFASSRLRLLEAARRGLARPRPWAVVRRQT